MKDPKAAVEKSSTAIIIVLEGSVNEREVMEENERDKAKIGVQTDTTADQLAHKKMRTEGDQIPKRQESSKDSGKYSTGKGGSYKQYDIGQQSAPGKLNWETRVNLN